MSRRARGDTEDAVRAGVVGREFVLLGPGTANTFLYEAKNFIRDLTGIINAAYRTKFDKASEFCKAKGGSKIQRWAADRFGAEDRLTKFLELHETWLWELVQKRNAVEHPKGHSGVLHVINYEMEPGVGIWRPTWYRATNQPTCIVPDMAAFCDAMLRFAEELTIYIIGKHLRSGRLHIYEIPESERIPQCPKRFYVGFTEHVMFAAAPSSSGGA
jgi:hypothetical protein